jgi:hypothetical protein
MNPVSLYWKPEPGGYSSGSLAIARTAAGMPEATVAFGGYPPSPALWVRSRRIVISSNCLSWYSFRYRPSGASSEISPRSTSDMTAIVVPTGFVSEAMSKMVSRVIGAWLGIRRREP